MLLDSILGGFGDGGYLFDAVPVEIEQRDGRAFLGREGAKGEVEVLMGKGGFSRGIANECPCCLDALHRATTRLVVEERVVGNLEEPRTELSLVLIPCRREVSLDQRILCQVVGIILLATAESKQEASECLLLTLNVGNEFFSCHGLSLLGQLTFFCFNLFGEHLLRYKIVDEESNAYGQNN